MWCSKCREAVYPEELDKHIQGDEWVTVDVCPWCGSELDASEPCPICGEQMKRGECACDGCKSLVADAVISLCIDMKCDGESTDVCLAINEVWDEIESRCREYDRFERMEDAKRKAETEKVLDGYFNIRKERQ